jgi:UDP-glucose 4-epimerase
MPFIAQVTVGKRPQLLVFGNHYPTLDGTGVRDYIHVEDLASAHLAAMQKLQQDDGAFYAINVGIGQPYSVLEVVRAFEKTSGKSISYEIVSRRSGDIAECYTDPALAKRLPG